MKQYIFSILFLSAFSQNCYVDNPRKKCEENANVLNFQAAYSFGKACLYPTSDSDPNNPLRCLAVALYNQSCRKKAETVYKADLAIDDSRQGKKENETNQRFGILALILLSEIKENGYVYYKGRNLLATLEYLAGQHIAGNAQNGETKTVSCSKSGTAKTVFFKEEWVISFQQCQHSTALAGDASEITWNGNFQGTLTYTKHSAELFLNRVSMFGTLQYSGNIFWTLFGSRSIDETCSVSAEYSSAPGKYIFCGRSSY